MMGDVRYDGGLEDFDAALPAQPVEDDFAFAPTAATECRLRLKKAGFDPIPVEGKKPPLQQWQTKVGASDDEIILWQQTWTYAGNTGILTQRCPVIDIDIMNPDAASALEELAFAKLCNGDRAPVRIGKAPKRAILFRTNEPFDKLNLEFDQGEKIEILGNGQQIVAFGVHPDTQQPYRWHGGEPGEFTREDLPLLTRDQAIAYLDAAEKLLIEQFGYKSPQRPRGEQTSDGRSSEPRAPIKRVRAALRVIPTNIGYDEWIKVGLATHAATAGSIEGLAAWDEWSQRAPKYEGSHETAGKWAGFKPGKIGAGTLFMQANEAKPDWENGIYFQGVDRSGSHSPDDDAKTGVPPFPFALPHEITLAPKQFLIDDFVGAAETSAWYGAPDSGKSTVALDAGCHVAAGVVYCGHRVTQGGVLYIAVERGAVVQRRVLAWCKRHGRQDIPLAVVTEMIDLRTGYIDADRIKATAEAFRQRCNLPVVWIIIDTLNRALAGGDENSSKDMGALIAAVDRIQRATGAHCSLIHHVPVDRTDRMRGHGSVLGAVDLTVRITKDDGIVMVEADKANDLIEKPRFAFRFESEELAREGLKVTTAPVLVPCDTPARASRPKSGPKSRAERIMRDAIAEALDATGRDICVRGGPVVRATAVQYVREQFAKRYVIESDDPKKIADAKRNAFNRALDRLSADFGAGEHNGDQWIWRT
jgi:AAA domain/Primase C terminal 2 (PriCT-2)/Bifunctional DNA primase/polymerase, N-terminal